MYRETKSSKNRAFCVFRFFCTRFLVLDIIPPCSCVFFALAYGVYGLQISRFSRFLASVLGFYLYSYIIYGVLEVRLSALGYEFLRHRV